MPPLSSPSDPSPSNVVAANQPQNGGGTGPHEPTSAAIEAGPSKGKRRGKGKAGVEGKSKIREKKVHKCTFEGCDKTFITPAHVRRHLRTREFHPTKRPLTVAVLCDMLLITMLCIDTGTQPYACEFCEKRFARSDVRNRHMQLSHKELYSNWLASLSLGRERHGSKQVGDDVMGNIEEVGDNTGRQDDYLDDDESGMQTDGRSSVSAMEARPSGHYIHDDLGNQKTNRPGRLSSTSHNGTMPRRPSSLQRDVLEHRSQERMSQQEGYQGSLSGLPNHPSRTHFVPPTMSVRDQRGPMDTGVPISLLAPPERNQDNPFHGLGREPSRTIYTGQQHRSETQLYDSHSLAEGDIQLRRELPRETISHNLEDVDATRDQREMFSRLDILLAAAAEPDTSHRDGVQGDARTSASNFASAGVQISNPPLPFPQNNPNSSLTPEAFIASTISLNGGNIPSAVSGSPLDIYGIEIDMGLYHDVFGWGLGAADLQQQAMGGHGDVDLNVWAHDMLDLSALNNPTEFVGGGVASSSRINAPGVLSNPIAEHRDRGSMAAHQLDESGLRDGDQAKRSAAEAVFSARHSERTTRQGTATPGNGEEETPWVREPTVHTSITFLILVFSRRFALLLLL